MSSEPEMAAKAQTLHMIGNAHLDPVWLWRWQEGFQEAKSTFRSVLDLMRKSTISTSPPLRPRSTNGWNSNDPGMFDEIKRRVAKGRWEIAGGWWIQPDCNLPSGESFVRQGLYGQRYFAEHLGSDGDGGVQRRQLRPRRFAAPDPAQERTDSLRLHATSAGGNDASSRGSSGGSRATARACWRFAYPSSTAPGARACSNRCAAARPS